jgi:hypothetical protein
MDTQDKDSLPSCDSNQKSYEGEMEHKLKDLGKKIDEMIEKADASKEESLAKLKEKKAEAETSLQTLKSASKDAWSEFKVGTDRAFEELQYAWMEISQASEKAIAKFQGQVSNNSNINK